MTRAKAEATLTAENTFTPEVSLLDIFNISITGTWDGTLHLQRKKPGESSFLDVEDWLSSDTTEIQEVGTEIESGVVYKLGFKTGNFNSGSAVVRLSQ